MSGTDFAPTCAVLGGVLAQDILNALGGREAPLVNFFVLDSETSV
jgi:ubiquitin-like 1-activating enzyme E1 A